MPLISYRRAGTMVKGAYMIKAVIDRFEGKKAVLLVGDDEQKVIFPRSELPNELSEGDYIKIEISYDEEATREAVREGAELLRELQGRNK